MFDYPNSSKSAPLSFESGLTHPSIKPSTQSALSSASPNIILETPITTTINSIHPYSLGASLYMPATRQDIWDVISRVKLQNLNSVIICLEDSVSEADVPVAMQNVEQLLNHWAAHSQETVNNDVRSSAVDSTADNSDVFDLNGCVKNNRVTATRPLVFIRPREPHMLMKLASLAHSNLIDGYVLPKVDMDSLSNWRMACQQVASDSLLMPTLETGRLFDAQHNHELKVALNHAFDERVFALRIGGNDLFASLRQRRPNNRTIYDTPIGTLIYQLLGTFAVQGYYLTAPVFEYFDNSSLFIQELEKDVELGLVGKTVIHPNQISLVQQAFSVPASILAEAQAILAQDAKAVFKFNDTMLEPATHKAWAIEVVQRANVFGTIERGVI